MTTTRIAILHTFKGPVTAYSIELANTAAKPASTKKV